METSQKPLYLDPVLVQNLATIVKRTNAQIVVSSTWRLEPDSMIILQKALALEGMEIIGSTGDYFGFGDRVDEILGWLTEH